MCAGEINQEYEMRWTMEHNGFEVCFCHVLNVIEPYFIGRCYKFSLVQHLRFDLPKALFFF